MQPHHDNTMQSKISKTFIWFLVLCMLTWLLGLIPFFQYTQNEIFSYVNSCHSKNADLFFSAITYIGTAWVIVPALLLLLLFPKYRNKRFFLLMALCNIVPSLVTQLIKNMLQRPRPLHLYKNETWLHFPEGQPMQYANSFPSGHTEAAFALCCFFALILPNKYKWCSALLFVLATLTAYSRIYLVQHFYADVFAGSIIGVVFCFLTYYIFPKQKSK